MRPGRLSGVTKRSLLRSRNAVDIVRKVAGIERSVSNYATFFLARPRASPLFYTRTSGRTGPPGASLNAPPLPSPFLH